MNWLKWKAGRRNTGYYKMLLFQWRWLVFCDLYLLTYASGSHVPEHTDPIPGYRHYIINFVIKQAKAGGEFISQHILYQGKRLKVFRSDFPHEVKMITSGNRHVLSFGLCLKDKTV